MSGNRQIFIISAYYPAGNNNLDFKNDLKRLYEYLKLDYIDNYYILGGDLNSKHSSWGNTIGNDKGVSLFDWLYENEIQYRCKLYASSSPSFPRSGSFLDIFIVDSRLIIHETGNSVNCLETLDYDSDHNAVKMVVSRNTQAEPLDFLQSSVTRTLDFKRTDWKKFEKLIMQALNNDSFIPANRNLSNDEIIFHVERLNNIITNAIDKSVPSFKEKDRLKELLNTVIKTLQKEKSRILTVIKKHNRFQNVLNPTVLCFMKNRLKMVRKLLQDNFVISMNKKLEQKFNKINSSNPSTMFSEAKKILRNRKADNINILKIPPEDMCLLHRAEIDHRTLRIENGSDKYVLEDEGHILNFIGAYLESIYSSKSTDETNLVHREVIEVFNSFLEDKVRYEEGLNTITYFNDMNLANDPVASNLDYFTSREEILYIFSKLKGKLSYGIDKIPNIILKKVPMLLIFDTGK
ncbi:uncharacterized protein LOC131996736 [Stomoxys calcitrans]|uniref:uncharacterized protein LOC131996736 n=1 Tax=Stomoxys calcitrans TaxID=35570 RepID=UPI0027E33F70|nr:uncharacterized protein LOC131996736 [Stomoxys calcitrans]